ncbi:MAG: M50 family metallopeptidase [bacterium]
MRFIVRFISTFLFFSLSVIYIFSFSHINHPGLLNPSNKTFWFLSGFIFYFPIHYAFRKAIILHIFSHELSHALWSMLFGGKIDEMYISRNRGGFTRYSRGNFLVTLAPYFFPLYTLIFLALSFIAKDKYGAPFVFLCGVSTSFHILLTVYSIKIGQPDLRKEGLAFSLSFILLMNILILGTVFLLISNQGEIKNFLFSGIVVFKNYFLNLIYNVAGYFRNIY